jgi:hypothetical protein
MSFADVFVAGSIAGGASARTAVGSAAENLHQR